MTCAEGGQRLAAGVEYDGTHYSGWQRQAFVDSVQQALENALASVANHPIVVVGAGRTDTGVHSLGQVFHFDVRAKRPMHGWLLGANTQLPNDISLQWVRPVSTDFHARFCATARTYRYVIYQARTRPALHRHQACWCRYPLDIDKMELAGQALVGKHDFTSLRAAGCQAKTPIRDVHWLRVHRKGDWVYIDVKANAFLHHMVRNIAGILLEIGGNRRPVPWAAEVLAAKDRRLAGMTAPAQGLYFIAIDYPESFGIPKQSNVPSFCGAWGE